MMKKAKATKADTRQARREFVLDELQCVLASVGNLQDDYSAETAAICTYLSTIINAANDALTELGKR